MLFLWFWAWLGWFTSCLGSPSALRIANLFVLGSLPCAFYSCFFAIAVNAINREAQEHKSDEESARIKSVEATNDQILKAVVNPPLDESQPARMYRVEDVLRNKYILTHVDISPEILAKTAWPPTDWMNQQLVLLHENFRFAEESKKPPVIAAQPPEPKKANVEFGFYTTANPDGIASDFTVVKQPDSSVVIPFTFRTTGNVVAHGLKIWVRVCDECSWKEEPAGFGTPDKNKPRDRDRFIGDFYPGPLFTEMDLHVGIPNLYMNTFMIAAYFACENCPPATKDSAQYFKVTVLGATPLGQLAPYTPTLGPQ